MRTLILAAFAVLAFVVGFFHSDTMTILFGVASAVGAFLSRPKIPLSTFLRVMAELFAVETVLFGLADIARLLGLWPESLQEYAVARYLPLATAMFVIVLTLIYRIPLVRKMMTIADPFFEARTPISIRPPLTRGFTLIQALYARGTVMALILINQFQVALGVRLNFFQNDFGNAIQVPDEAHRIAFWHQLLGVFLPLAFIIIASAVLEYFIAANFVIQWRRWMTANYTGRWLVNSMHYKLALAAHGADNPDQRISQDIGGFINGSGTGSNSGNYGIYNYTIQLISAATNLTAFSIILWRLSAGMNAPFFNIEIPGFLFWVATIYAVFATGVTQLIGSRLVRLFFRQQVVEANFRFDLARIREYSEQIALLKGEAREIEHAGVVFDEVFRTACSASSGCAPVLSAFTNFYAQVSVIIPYVIVAPFYYLKQVSFGVFNQAADAFSSVNNAMNFFIDRYVGLADFKSDRRPSDFFDEAFLRAYAAQSLLRDRQQAERRRGAGHSRARIEPAGRPQTGAHRQPDTGPPKVDVGHRPERRGQVDDVSRHRRALALRQGRDFAACPRQADAAAAASLHPAGTAALCARLSGSRQRVYRRRTAGGAARGRSSRAGRQARRGRAMADAAFRRRAAAPRGGARAARQAGLVVPRRSDRFAGRSERSRPLSRDCRGVAQSDPGFDRPPLDAISIPQAPHHGGDPSGRAVDADGMSPSHVVR